MVANLWHFTICRLFVILGWKTTNTKRLLPWNSEKTTERQNENSKIWIRATTTKKKKKNKYNLLLRNPIYCVFAQHFDIFLLFRGEKTTRINEKTIISDLSLTNRDLQSITQFCLLFYIHIENFYKIKCAVFSHLWSFNNDENYLPLLDMITDWTKLLFEMTNNTTFEWTGR